MLAQECMTIVSPYRKEGGTMTAKSSTVEKSAPVRSKSTSSAKGKSSKKKMHNVDLGKRGEDAASKFLNNRGYDIV